MHSESSTYSFGRGATPASIAYVNCRGTESNLAECTYSTGQILSSCISYDDDRIGVYCKSGMSKSIALIEYWSYNYIRQSMSTYRYY